MNAGAGSAVVSSSQQLGAIVQIQARNQIATLGSYKGSTEGKTSFYAPLLARRGSSLSGLANAQIIIQNAGTGPVDVDVNFLPNPKADGTAYTKTITGIPQGASSIMTLKKMRQSRKIGLARASSALRLPLLPEKSSLWLMSSLGQTAFKHITLSRLTRSTMSGLSHYLRLD